MKVSEMFPKKYAAGEDIKQPVTLIIRTITREQMHPQPGSPAVDKYVIYFERATKGIILTPTLARQIAAIHGDDTTAWTGKPIRLFTEPMTVAGKPRLAIRAQRAPNGVDSTPETLQEGEEE